MRRAVATPAVLPILLSSIDQEMLSAESAVEGRLFPLRNAFLTPKAGQPVAFPLSTHPLHGVV